jgi:hypothetical protein
MEFATLIPILREWLEMPLRFVARRKCDFMVFFKQLNVGVQKRGETSDELAGNPSKKPL